MKKITLYLAALALLGSACTHDNGEEWIVKGTVPLERLNGYRVFIVPCDPKSMMFTSKHFEDSLGVDSVVIKDGKFEFRGHGEYLARITIDKKVRYGTQDLLVVTEPGGVVTVVIDSISSGRGTPQNDVLQQWKDAKTEHDRVVWNQTQRRNALQHAGDTAYARALTDSLRAYNRGFAKYMVQLADDLGQGPAYDVLTSRYGN